MATKKKDPFIAFRPTTKEVAVGDGIFILKTATLDQEARFLAVMDEIELGKLIGPVTTLMQGGGDDQETATPSATNFVKKIQDVGPELWSAARIVLGRQFAPAVREACIAMLDNQGNYESLVKSGLVSDGDCDTGPDGEFLGSGGVRKILKSDLTLIQGIQIIKSAWDINGYGAIVGNLLTMGQAA